MNDERGTMDPIVHRSAFILSTGFRMAVTCDILIIGGGVIGASIAHALGQRRAGRVILLEKAYLGAGVSGKRPR